MKRSRWFAPALVFLACFAAYVVTLNPAFRADDSPETIAASVTLGIQHPPAYPLFTLVGRLFSFIPVATPAFRINLMAAFFGALTCALLCVALQAWLQPKEADEPDPLATGAAMLAGIVLGLSQTFWSQSLAAKGGIYTLHSACMAGLLLCLVLWGQVAEALPAGLARRDRQGALLRSRWFLLGVLLFAVGLGNHWETQALLAPATLAYAAFLLRGPGSWVFWRRAPEAAGKSAPKKGERPPPASAPAPWPLSLWAWPLAFFALGLSVYAYLPLRAQHSPFLNWGDPRDWQQFWWVFQRQEYLDLEVGFLRSLRAALFGGGPWQDVAEAWTYVQRQALRVLGHLFGAHADLGWPCMLLALFGGWTLARACVSQGRTGWTAFKARALALWMALLLAAFAFVITFYFHLKAEMVWILDVFLIPAYLVQAALAGLGAYALAQRATAWGAQQRRAWVALCFAAPLALAAGLFVWQAPSVTQARQFLAWDYGKDLLLSAKRNAIVLAEGDFNTMPVYYLQQVAGQRLDVDHVTTVFLSTDWGAAHARRVQPRLGIGDVPKTITGARAGDGQVLRAALSQIAIRAQAEHRPIQTAWFRQVQAETVREWEPGFHPSGLLTELNGPLTPAEDQRRLGLIKALRTRHLEFDRDHLDPSPEFALSNYGTAYLELANFLRLRGDFRTALPLYRGAEVVTTHSNLPEILTHEGIALAAGGGPKGPAPDPVTAATIFRRSIALRPLFEAYANLAGVCNQLGQTTKQSSYFIEAEAAAGHAVQMQPSSAQAWNNLAIAQYYQNRRDEAVATLRRAVQLAPGDPQITANLHALGG